MLKVEGTPSACRHEAEIATRSDFVETKRANEEEVGKSQDRK